MQDNQCCLDHIGRIQRVDFIEIDSGNILACVRLIVEALG